MPTAVISPRDHLAGILSPDGASVQVRPHDGGRQFSLSTRVYLNRFPDSRFAAVGDWNGATDTLSSARDQSTSLDFTLMLFDSELSIELRKSVADELETLISNAENRDYALDILLALPLPDAADVDGARIAAEQRDAVATYVNQLVEAQERVRFARRAWHALQSHPMVRDTNVLRGTFIRYGVIRRLTLEATTQSETDTLIGNLVYTKGLTKECDPRVIHAFASEYKAFLPTGSDRYSTSHASVEKAPQSVKLSYGTSGRASASKAISADDLADWAAGQVRTIADLFRTGKDQIGGQYAEELISSQTQFTTNYTYVVKSLCNLSQQCNLMGRRDLSQQYLLRAFEFESGIDSVAYAQLGNECMRLSELEHAQRCYVKAKELEHDPSRIQDLVRKLIRVTVYSGKYHEALAEYDKLSDLWENPRALTDRGVLLRKMGNLPGARESYRYALSLDPERHQAFAGLAEARKQAGKLERALKAYSVLLHTCCTVDAHSRKIYLLATSHLLRLTGRMSKARRVLDELIVEYPLDPDINHQLGVLLTLIGERDEGLQRIQVAKDGRQSQRLSNELLSLVMDGRPVVSNAGAGLNQYMPEERGLAACGLALTALMQESFEDVFTLTSTASHVDKLHRDFALTLQYHARKRIDMKFNYKTVQPLARIAKRGQRELRDAIQAIAEGRFSDAFEHENRMCLHLTI